MLTETLGWLAAALTVVTFSMRSMIALRAIALGANICFLMYGALESLLPVLALHAILLPCNMMRLHGELRQRGGIETTSRN